MQDGEKKRGRGRPRKSNEERKLKATQDLKNLSVNQIRQASLYAEIEKDAFTMIEKLKEQANRGNTIALKLLIERILPAKKYTNITFTLNSSLRNVTDIAEAVSIIIDYVSKGKISPEQGKMVADLLQIQKDIIISNDIDERLTRIEQALSVKTQEKEIEVIEV